MPKAAAHLAVATSVEEVDCKGVQTEANLRSLACTPSAFLR